MVSTEAGHLLILSTNRTFPGWPVPDLQGRPHGEEARFFSAPSRTMGRAAILRDARKERAPQDEDLLWSPARQSNAD
jgi:hypothetical protein